MAYLENAGTGCTVKADLAAGMNQTGGSRQTPAGGTPVRLDPGLLWLLLFPIWELSARSGWISALFFPPPTAIVITLAKMLISGKLPVNLGYTLGRLFAGLVMGGSAGLALGLLMGWSSQVRAAAGPMVAATHPLPKLALLPLALIIFGIGETSKVVLIAMAAFFPLVINSMAGVQQIDERTWEVAHHYRAQGWILFRRILWPAALPLVLTGLQLAANAALLITVAVELVTAQQGLGAIIWLAWQTLRTEELYAVLLVIGLLGMLFNPMLEKLTRHLVPWNRQQTTC